MAFHVNGHEMQSLGNPEQKRWAKSVLVDGGGDLADWVHCLSSSIEDGEKRVHQGPC